MYHKAWISFLFIALLFSMLLSGCNKASDSSSKASESTPIIKSLQTEATLAFLSPDYQVKSSLQIAIAESQQERNLGLMEINQMKSNEGMLFIFDQPQPLQFWMANTPLSLDILFVDADSVITHIHKNTKALSQERYDNEGQPGLFVVETNAGYTTLNDIQIGDRIRF
jgi:hypothetical protein